MRRIDAAIDFGHLYDFVDIKSLYSEGEGRPSVDPVVLFKIVLIQHLYGIVSLRQTMREIDMNMACRWFLGYSLNDEIPHFSTVSYNFRHRYTEETIEQVFRWILWEVNEAGALSPGAVFIDGTHIKANANIHKKIKQEVPAAAKRYREELMAEINADREAHGKKPFDDVYDKVTEQFPEIETVVADSAYKTPHICKKVFDDDRVLSTAYKRPQTIERVFADAKEKHAMRYTQYRGLAQVSKWVRLKFVAMNLKKLALWKWRSPIPAHALLLFFRSFFLMHENRAYAAA